MPLLNDLGTLKEQRKNGEIDILSYYKGLIKITALLLEDLINEDISEKDAKKQIPLVLVFLEEQIAELAGRGG